MRDGADDQDHDDIPNLMELSRIAASGGRSTARATCKPDPDAPKYPDTNHPNAYGRVNPFNPCLPYRKSRDVPHGRQQRHRRPVRRLAELVLAEVSPLQDLLNDPGPAFVRALVVKGCAAEADAVLMSRPLLPWAALAVLGAVALAWLGLLGFFFTDYEVEAAPAFAALTHGYSGSSSS